MSAAGTMAMLVKGCSVTSSPCFSKMPLSLATKAGMKSAANACASVILVCCAEAPSGAASARPQAIALMVFIFPPLFGLDVQSGEHLLPVVGALLHQLADRLGRARPVDGESHLEQRLLVALVGGDLLHGA